MGLIWNLIQHGQISENRDKSSSLQRQIDDLGDELRKTNETLMALMRALEQRFGDDLDGDGRVG